MKRHIYLILLSIGIVCAETLFEVKDSANNPVLKVSDDGIAVMNLADTIMVISTTEIKAVIDDSTKALSRKFSVSTTSAKKGLYTDLFDVTLGSATMRESGGGKYTDFSPENIFVGINAGVSTTPLLPGLINGIDNIFIGNGAGINNQGGYSNIFIGKDVGSANVSGKVNIFIGTESGKSNLGGDANTYLGNYTGKNNAEGVGNCFFGNSSGGSNTGSHNTFIGSSSGNLSDLSSNNTYIGYGAGGSAKGSNNIFIGHESGAGTSFSGTDCVFIGNGTGYFETGSNKLYIANSNTSTPLIKGTFPNTDLTFKATTITADGNLNITGTTTSSGLITGNNNIRILNAPGTGTAPTYYAYQGALGSSIQSDAFAIRDALWVDTNGYIDLNLTVGGLTSSGSLILGSGASVNEFSTDGTLGGDSDLAVPTEKAVRTYVTASKDNLGNHTATQNIRLSGYYLSNDGGSEGVYVDTGGDVGIGTNAPGTSRLRVLSSATGIEGSTGYFNNTGTGGIALSAKANTTDVVLFVGQDNTTATGYIAKFTSNYGGYKEMFNIANDGRLNAPFLGTGTGSDLYVTTAGDIVKYSSSRKYKKDIVPLSVDITKFMKLQPVNFKWNEKSSSENKDDFGLIAEDVEKIDPLLATYNEDGSIEGVDYKKVNIMLLKVVQDQEKKIKKLEDDIAIIKTAMKIGR